MSKFDRFEDFKFATKIYRNEDDDVLEQFLKLKAQFKMRYKDREITIEEIDEETFSVETKDIIIVFAIINDTVYQFYY